MTLDEAVHNVQWFISCEIEKLEEHQAKKLSRAWLVLYKSLQEKSFPKEINQESTLPETEELKRHLKIIKEQKKLTKDVFMDEFYKLNMTQGKLAKVLGVSRQTVSVNIRNASSLKFFSKMKRLNEILSDRELQEEKQLRREFMDEFYKLNMTQAELAETLGISQQAVSKQLRLSSSYRFLFKLKQLNKELREDQ